MPTDPSLALQAAFVAAIKALNTEAGARVYDRVPKSNGTIASGTFPYVALGTGSVLNNQADCYDGSDVSLTVHVWSRAVGWPEAKRIADAIRTGLNNAELTLTGHTLELLTLDRVDYLNDPDGLTSHAALTFRALTQPQD